MQIINDLELLRFKGQQESQYLIKPSSITDLVLERFNGVDQVGDILPWSKTHKYVALRPGEVSLWGGYNGHGKSQILGQVCAWGLLKSKWLIASLEMKPEATMHRMTRQITGNSEPEHNYVKEFLKWTDEKLWIYDQLDTVHQDKIIGLIHYSAQKYGIQHVVIDSLMKCGIPNDDLNAQKQFIDRICWAAKTENVHAHIVHHMRKGHTEFDMPGKHDFRGAGEITDLVDNVFIIHRNKSI